MYKKTTFAVVLIAFACAQIAYSLTCYECNGTSECSRTVTCTKASANNTNYILSQTHSNVPNYTTSNFDCFRVNYTLGNSVVSLVQGCVYREHNACNYQTNNPSWRKDCRICSGNNCNTKNPAATFSSSFYSLLGSAVFLLIAKFSLF